MKLFLFYILSFFLLLFGGISYGQAPSFDDFGSDIDSSTYDIDVDSKKDLQTNILSIFYPTEKNSQIWQAIRIIGVGIFFVFLVWGGVLFLLGAGDESSLKKAKMNLIYIMYGGVLFFGVTWILGTALNIGGVTGTEDLVGNIGDNIMFQVLSFLKAAAFFMAVVMIFYYGYRMIQAFEKEDKISEARKGIINVVVALVFIKVIDFIYYIAQQNTFKTQAGELLIGFSKILGYILGALLIISIFYSGFLMITSRGEEDQFNKGKNIIKAVFIISLIIMLFLLIIYQVIGELG
ncbi:hypothetical protein [Candidatus Vampirococcus lugosii]|uniref:Uncharacterized protein n=1 Tax=Candidatus Vampirococcus lugosii TaxID=2789015 RepID=A0ABS5QMU4_9BACT|nr:hypothetical protein [Candidatus Vampirococcus lugosii]MBS8122540.1 hypothetical protein [Candidatus Vampirococcus lugosii]